MAQMDCFVRAQELMRAEGWQEPVMTQNNGWSKISERTPPLGTPILLCCERGTVAIGWAREDGELQNDLPRGIEFEPIWWQANPICPQE